MEDAKEEVQETQQEKAEEERLDLYEFFDLDKKDPWKDIEDKVFAKLGTAVATMREALGSWLKEHAEELALEFPNIAPHGDYGKLLEDNDSMSEFLKTDAYEPKNWKMVRITLTEFNNKLISFWFLNEAVNDGEDGLEGRVFTNHTGIVRHAFAQVVE